MATEHTTEHAAEHSGEMTTASDYINHHLSFNVQPVGQGDHSFWNVIHFDMFIISLVLGLIVAAAVWLVARKATSGVPSKTQAFVELIFDFVDGQVKGMFHGDRHAFIAPTALTIFLWVLAMNLMDLVPIDWFAKFTGLFGESHAPFRPLPTSDVNTTFALALSVWILMIFFSIKAKGVGGWIHEIFGAPFGMPKLFKPKSFMGLVGLLVSPLLFLANFMFNMIEYISKPLSHSMRLFGNLYASEVIFLLIGMLAATSIVGMFGAVILGAMWAIFHILVVPLQAFIFMMMTIVYLSMAHEHH
ncbi:MAG: F0F1 ATP synthase subunit A [Methylophilaceae bacterium]|jgi:F-type H+-transporting ATPase subunit a|nr:F0F1 ATP synthase subunit A [Methylophilaceae bacterium]MDG1454153.1 F0F1 ATP synthase subunit A [Methylophilaceae bacterium]